MPGRSPENDTSVAYLCRSLWLAIDYLLISSRGLPVHYWQHREIKICADEHARKDIFKFEEIRLSPSIASVFSLASGGSVQRRSRSWYSFRAQNLNDATFLPGELVTSVGIIKREC